MPPRLVAPRKGYSLMSPPTSGFLLMTLTVNYCFLILLSRYKTQRNDSERNHPLMRLLLEERCGSIKTDAELGFLSLISDIDRCYKRFCRLKEDQLLTRSFGLFDHFAVINVFVLES